VRLEDFIQTANNYYLVFEHCAGGDLQKYLREKGPLDELKAQRFMYQIAQALRQLSLNEIMHRDLKPQNILLDEQSPNAVIKLADFGLAKYFNSGNEDDSKHDMENTVCGTPAYMAPEAYDYRDYGKQADIWSCGALFLEMLVGNRPWPGCIPREEGPKKQAFFHRFSEGSIDLADHGVRVSTLCLALLRKMLQKNPERRMTWLQFFEHPMIKHESSVYPELLKAISHPNMEYIQESSAADEDRGEKADSKDGPDKPTKIEGGIGKATEAETSSQKRTCKKKSDPKESPPASVISLKHDKSSSNKGEPSL